MNYDEFSFMNQQLAGMLRDGIPLEGALRQLCQSMHRGPLRAELAKLEEDLANGVPLKDALAARKLPEFYVQMVQVGIKGNDLPGMLTLLADYYQKANAIWIRLKGLMVYPLIVLFCSLILSVWFAFLFTDRQSEIFQWFQNAYGGFGGNYSGLRSFTPVLLNLWMPPLTLALVSGAVIMVIAVPSLRRSMRWHLPAFREGALAQFGSAMGVLIKGGSSLGEAITLLRQLEKQTGAGVELARWQQRCGDGHAKFAEVAANSKLFPALFVWLVASAGEDLAAGFFRAAEVYYARATFRTELLLNAALPVSLVLLGLMIMGQIYPLMVYVYDMFLPMIQMVNLVSKK